MSKKSVPRNDGSYRLNRKNIANHDKIKGSPEARVQGDANREALSAEIAAKKGRVAKVYLGEEVDKLINGRAGVKMSADAVAVTKNGRYMVYEAKGGEISHGLDQLEYTSKSLGTNKVDGLTLITKKRITTPGYTVKDGQLMLNNEKYLVDGKPVNVIFTSQ